ncbi:uncharacterized protein ABDE67_011946 [Symphorus nematophorus]
MAQWQELLRLDSALQGLVSQLYEGRFPREIRQCLCQVIESHDWDLAAVDESQAKACFCALVLNLEEQWSRSVQENNILQAPNFSGMREYLQKNFQNEPLKLAGILSACLKGEKKILASACETKGCSSPIMEQTWRMLDNKVNELKQRTSEAKKEIKSLEVLNEQLDFIQENWPIQVEQHVGLAQSHAVVQEECLKKANVITQTKQRLLQQLEINLKLAQEIVVTLTDVELPEWKCRQQMACIGSPVDTSLDHLQMWFTTVAEVLLRVREQLQKLQEQNKKYNSTDASNLTGPMAEMEKFTVSLLIKLLSNALVLEKQPVLSSLPQRPLILKTGVRFTMTVRFLANLPEFKCLLKVTPVFDKDVEEAKTVKGFRHFEISRSNGKVLDVDTPGGGLVAEFGLMSLKETKGKAKGSPKSLKETKGKAKGSPETRLGVTEELHVIKFVTFFQHAGLECNIEVSSLPVVVISSTNQVLSAWATVIWCNMLSTSEPRNLSLFVDPPPLTWQQLSQVLSWQFLSVGQRGLDENQLSMLRDKFVDDPDDLIHWSKFSKNESAWIWIDGILDLIKRHLVDLWRDGSIMGFVSRKRTQALLQEKQPGTFLLRFSESNKDGAITFSFVEYSNGGTHVRAVEPYTKLELSVKCLPDIINLYSVTDQKIVRNPLVYLYPDIPKDSAFGRYYTTSGTSAPKKVGDGYFHRSDITQSVYPTPPPSPPSPMMDMDQSMETDQRLKEMFPDLFNSPEPYGDYTSYQQVPPMQSNCFLQDFDVFFGARQMAQWQELLRLDSALQGLVSQLYEGRFPREIRQCLCQVIESHDWDLAAVDESQAKACFCALVLNLEEQWSRSVQENNILQAPNFSGMREYLQRLLQQLVINLKLAQEIVGTLTDVELPEWKRRQQMACIGSPVDTSLDHLQKWFTTVAEVLLRVREQLQKLQEQNKKYNSTDASNLTGPMAEMEKFTVSLLIKLLSNALVLEKQPVLLSLPQRPLILKTGVRFTMTVRFLANLPEFKCLLKVTPVFDKDVEEAKTVKGFRHFNFSRDDCKMLDVDTPGGGLVAEFGHMSLKETKGRAKGSTETRLGVTEELHVIKFVTFFQHAGLECNIEVSSLPVVVISSTTQVLSAWATVMWCNMLSTSEPRNLSLFVDPPPLTWQQLSQVLSWQFLSVGQRGLDENQLSMLRDKFVDDPDDLVHWSKFSKNESAWIWIDGILDLIKKHLVDLWQDGSIMGFVSRKRTRALLQEKQPGTFLLRFSESNKDGAITFSWVEHSNGETHVHSVEPYTKHELSILCLPDIIYHYSLRAQRNMPKNPLVYLYPDIPKDTAFGRYYTIPARSAPKKVVDGYVIRTLIPVSVHPTPPPSPPRESPMMDMDIDPSMDAHQLLEELFSDLFDSSELFNICKSLPQISPTENNFFNPGSSF